MMRGFLPTLLGAALAAAAPAQVASTVGPPVAPLGCNVAIAFSNDTQAVLWTGICPYVVKDTQGRIVFTPICPAIARQVPPGSTFHTFWEQTDNNGTQVPPGTYVVEVTLPGGTVNSHTINIDTRVTGGVVNLGAIRPGTARQIYACSPQQTNALFYLGASFSANRGIPTCGGLFPLDPDLLLGFSLALNPVFLDFRGTFVQGATTDPTILLPAIPTLTGLPMSLAFFTFDPSPPCPFTSTSAPTSIVVQ